MVQRKLGRSTESPKPPPSSGGFSLLLTGQRKSPGLNLLDDCLGSSTGCIFLFVKCFSGMGEFLVPATADFPLQLALAVACIVGLTLYLLLQPGEGGDDDDNNSGGGGLMQPVAMGATG